MSMSIAETLYLLLGCVAALGVFSPSRRSNYNDRPTGARPKPPPAPPRVQQNTEFSGVPAGHSSNHPAGGTSAATQG
jgi:hypothetical protein